MSDASPYHITDARFWDGSQESPRTAIDAMRLSVDEESVAKALRDYLQLTEDQALDLSRAEASDSRNRMPRSLAALLMRWVRIVRLMEFGYPFGGDDYINDLATREGLERLMTRAPYIQSQVSSLLSPWDARFRRATRASAEPLGGPRGLGVNDISPEGPGWWYFREPRGWADEDN